MEEEIKNPVVSKKDVVIVQSEQKMPEETASVVEAEADQHEASAEIATVESHAVQECALDENVETLISAVPEELVADELEEPSDDQPCNCCEEQKKQTGILKQISQSLKSFFDKHKKLELISCVVGVVGLIISCLGIYKDCTTPTLHEELNYVLQEYQSINELQLPQLPESLLVYREVKALYATHKRIEILKKELRDYPIKIGKICEMKVSMKNMLEYCTEAQNYNNWDTSVNTKVEELQDFAKTYSLMGALDKDIFRKFDQSLMEKYVNCAEERIKLAGEYTNKLTFVANSYKANAHLSKDLKVRKKLQKRIEDLDNASSKLFDKEIQINYYKSMLGWITVLEEIVDYRLRQIEVESLEGKYDPSGFETSSILQKYIYSTEQDKE